MGPAAAAWHVLQQLGADIPQTQGCLSAMTSLCHDKYPEPSHSYHVQIGLGFLVFATLVFIEIFGR